ncbi:MAG TPA: zinc-binding dehydrogenase [Acidimicrobiales bacterium]|nr:zinc-binding dehydrogenase [Acidimicrobiales bacterium]
MLALTIDEKRLEVIERDTPEPGPDDVVVAVRAAGINAADLMQREGFYPAPPGFPDDVPGMELTGLVTDVGEGVSASLIGRRVCAIVGGGAQATHCVVASEHLLFVPDHVSWTEAGGFPEAFTTAFDALVTQGRLQSGERALVSGAAGGVGAAGVQIAHALGAEVVAVTRNDEHHGALRALGADETITLDEVGSLEPVDVVLELLGAANLSAAQRVLRPHARVVVIGVGAGARVEIDLLSMMRSRFTLTGSTLRSRSREEKSAVASMLRQALLPLWERRTLSVPIAKAFDLRDAVAAYDFFGQPGKFGKVVLLVNE